MSRVIPQEMVRLVSGPSAVESDELSAATDALPSDGHPTLTHAEPYTQNGRHGPSQRGTESGKRPAEHRSAHAAAILEAARIVADARAKATRLEEEAAVRGREIVAAAEGQAEQIRQDAWQDGYASGIAAGKEAAQAELAETFASVRLIVAEAERVRDRALSHVQGDAVKLALAVAEKLVRRQLDLDPGLAVRVAEAALRKAAGSKRLIIRMNPQDLAVGGDQLQRVVRASGEVELREDPGIQPGGCVIETEHGVVDGRFETRLVEVSKALLDVMSDAG